MIDVIKRAKNKYEKHISTPLLAYASAFVLGSCFLIVSCLFPGGTAWNDYCLNIGYGTIAALPFAVLVDIGNTERENKKKKAIWKTITSEWRNSFLRLRESAQYVAEELHGCDNTKRTFSQWLERAFFTDDEISEEEFEEIIFSLEFCIKDINGKTIILNDRMITTLFAFDDIHQERMKIKTISSISYLICLDFENANYEKARKSIEKTLLPRFLKICPEYSEEFNCPYNCNCVEEDD